MNVERHIYFGVYFGTKMNIEWTRRHTISAISSICIEADCFSGRAQKCCRTNVTFSAESPEMGCEIEAIDSTILVFSDVNRLSSSLTGSSIVALIFCRVACCRLIHDFLAMVYHKIPLNVLLFSQFVISRSSC
jgi:hypothetical protein